MKLHVTYDRNGDIIAIAMPRPDKDRDVEIGDVGVRADSTYEVVEVDAPGDPDDFPDEESVMRRLAEILEEFRIETPAQRGKLVARRFGRSAGEEVE